VYLFNFLRLVILKVVSEISKQSKDKESQKGKNKKPSPRVKKIASQTKLPKEKDTTSIKVTVVVQKEDNWYVAKCIENNVVSQGKSIEESLENLKEALELYYEDTMSEEKNSATLITIMEVPL
jgi:predicted RNase H-like HicB family nuclease